MQLQKRLQKQIQTLPLITLSIFAAVAGLGCDQSEANNPALDAGLREVLAVNGIGPLTFSPQEPSHVNLGRALFHDKELSGNRDISCGTCHNPRAGASDGLSLAIGTKGRGLGLQRRPAQGLPYIFRNAPPLYNRGANETSRLLWDGSILGDVLAAQALGPLANRAEMLGRAGDRDAYGRPNELAMLQNTDAVYRGIMARVLSIPHYQVMFQSAFPQRKQYSIQDAATAIAAYQAETFRSVNSSFDRFIAGDPTAMSSGAKRGGILFFGEAGCSRCHNGPLLSDQQLHNVGTPVLSHDGTVDRGGGSYNYLTPPLRNVEITGPWNHNGSFTSLEQVVRHYTSPAQSLRAYSGGNLDPQFRERVVSNPQVIEDIISNMDPMTLVLRPLTDQDVFDLVLFLRSLTDTTFVPGAPSVVPSGLPVDR